MLMAVMLEQLMEKSLTKADVIIYQISPTTHIPATYPLLNPIENIPDAHLMGTNQ
jgi:hypothetical protein